MAVSEQSLVDAAMMAIVEDKVVSMFAKAGSTNVDEIRHAVRGLIYAANVHP